MINDDPWLNALHTSVQEVVFELERRDTAGCLMLLSDLAAKLPPAPHAFGNAILAAVLLNVCHRAVDVLHRRQSADTCLCRSLSWQHLGNFSRWPEVDPRITFRQWVEVFTPHFGRQHAPSPSVDAARLIQLNTDRRWRTGLLARQLGTNERSLRADFRQQFGCSPMTYVQLIRTIKAIDLLPSCRKVETVALEVGFRSRKDLYAAFQRWIGQTPREVRKQNVYERRLLRCRLQARCIDGRSILSARLKSQ
jgi:AraC-like DNA-binding protein